MSHPLPLPGPAVKLCSRLCQFSLASPCFLARELVFGNKWAQWKASGGTWACQDGTPAWGRHMKPQPGKGRHHSREAASLPLLAGSHKPGFSQNRVLHGSPLLCGFFHLSEDEQPCRVFQGKFQGKFFVLGPI